MHRFCLPDLRIKDRLVTLSDDRLVHQLKRVLRMRQGELITIFNGTEKKEYVMEILAMEGHKIELHLREEKENRLEPKRLVHLYQAIPKKAGAFELILQKATEIGVSAITPMITARTENRRLSKLSRREAITREAAEQCGRAIVPILHSPITFEATLEKAVHPYLGYEYAVEHGLLDFWPQIEKQETISILIGPEGGFTGDELSLAKQRNVPIFSMGKRILRVETATLAALSLVLLSHLE